MGKMRTRQKLAIASWNAPKEGNIYGKVVVDATAALAYLEHVRQTTGVKATLTHLVGKAAGMVLREAPSLNGTIVLGGYRAFPTVDVAFLVNLEGGNDLAKAKVTDIDGKSVETIARELGEAADKLRKGKDESFKKAQGPLKLLPTWLIRPLVHFSGFLASGLGINLPMFGLEANPFGSCIVTNVGMFGIDEAYAPPTPWARVPVYLLVNAVKDRPTVVDGQVVVRPNLTVTATIDHRYIDGAQLGVLAKILREVLENPWSLEGLQGPPSA